MNERERRIARARLLRREGKTYNEIREVIGSVDDSTLRIWCRGIPRPPDTWRSHPKHVEKRRARQLRMAGHTYPEIAAELGVAMGSLSLWLRDLPVPERVRRRRVSHLQGLRGSGGEKLHRRALERRAARVEVAQHGVGQLSERELFFVGLALYWAEGSKDKPWKRHGRVRLTNSDVGIVGVYLAWLELLGIDRRELSFSLSIHESYDVAEHQDWWQKQLGLEPTQFRGPMLKRHNPKPRRHNTGEQYHGCLVVTVARSAALYDAIDGWWSAIPGGFEGRRTGDGPLVLGLNDPGSSNGRTLGFGPSNWGSNPYPGAGGPVSSPWLPARWWDVIAPVPSKEGSGSDKSGSFS